MHSMVAASALSPKLAPHVRVEHLPLASQQVLLSVSRTQVAAAHSMVAASALGTKLAPHVMVSHFAFGSSCAFTTNGWLCWLSVGHDTAHELYPGAGVMTP